MALEIITLDETFEVKGTLNKSNVEKFQSYFKDIFNRKNKIVINFDELKSVDSDGVLAFEDIYKQSLQHHKRLYITGIGCRDMYDHLKSIKVA
jgi:anti-anti-sigma regulatory factor